MRCARIDKGRRKGLRKKRLGTLHMKSKKFSSSQKQSIPEHAGKQLVIELVRGLN